MSGLWLVFFGAFLADPLTLSLTVQMNGATSTTVMDLPPRAEGDAERAARTAERFCLQLGTMDLSLCSAQISAKLRQAARDRRATAALRARGDDVFRRLTLAGYEGSFESSYDPANGSEGTRLAALPMEAALERANGRRVLDDSTGLFLFPSGTTTVYADHARRCFCLRFSSPVTFLTAVPRSCIALPRVGTWTLERTSCRSRRGFLSTTTRTSR